jgi:hypothetical protein
VPTVIKRGEEILDVLHQACARKEMLILVTPYLRYESYFVAMEEKELHVLATMTREDALFGLATPELKIRFPHGLGFYEASSRMLGLGLHQSKHTIRLTLPKLIQENDQRTTYRVERVGRISVTLTTRKNAFQLASLEDVSVAGARIHMEGDYNREDLGLGELIQVSVPLAEDLRFDAQAVIRHVRGRTLGAEFRPELPPEMVQPLSRWVFLKREEEGERLARQLELGLSSSRPPEVLPPNQCILLISPDAALEGALQEALRPLLPLTRFPPSAQALKEGLAARPQLVIFHVTSNSLDARRRLKALAEIVSGRAPILLLGTGVEGVDLSGLATHLKAATAMVWTENRALFLERLVQGILRRSRSGGEGPMAPLGA